MPKLSPRFLLPLLVVVLVVAAFLVWRHEQQPPAVATRGMAAGTVVSSSPSGSDLSLTVRYVAAGRPLETTGTVPAAGFAQQGKVVWVCFNPSATSETVLRLPMDQLCANGG